MSALASVGTDAGAEGPTAAAGAEGRDRGGGLTIDYAERACRRILLVDDDPAIHDDFRKVLGGPSAAHAELEQLEAQLSVEPFAPARDQGFELDSALQGREALACVEAACRERPYAVAFVDVRMPPGMDGIETAARLLQIDPRVQIVLCTAYADYAWDAIHAKLQASDGLLIVRKPFDPIEIRQAAHALCAKWQLARANEAHSRELQRQVDARTRELAAANEQLRHEMDQRLEAEREQQRGQRLQAIGQLTAGIAHEINNPLTYMIANLEHLLPVVASLAEQHRTALADALYGATRIKAIVQDIMLFARGRREEPATAVDVAEIAKRATLLLGHPLRRRARLIESLEPVPPVMAQAPRLEQVIVNLLSNALQAIDEAAPGPMEVRLGTRYERPGTVVIEVADTGCGIPPEDLSRVCEPFFTTRDVGEGTGLGLSVCHGIVTSLGGTLSILSSPAQGTTVTVRLPAAPTEHPSAGAALSPPGGHADGTKR